jgi:hypothetical protein
VAYNNVYKKGSNLLATAYYKYSTDLITNYIYKDINPINNDSAFYSSFINANTSKVFGLEISNKTAITKWWDLNLSFNLFKSEINSTIVTLPAKNIPIGLYRLNILNKEGNMVMSHSWSKN